MSNINKLEPITLIQKEVDRLLKVAMVLNDFEGKHIEFLHNTKPDLIFAPESLGPSLHFEQEKAVAVASYFGNDDWQVVREDVREKIVDGVRICVFGEKQEMPETKLVPHLDVMGGIGCKTSVTTLHSLN